MAAPLLESIAQSLNYGDLPETWQVSDIQRFSSQKTLYDYQRSALENAARALHLYYGQENRWQANEAQDTNNQRKQDFAGLYARTGQSPIAELSVKKYERNADRRNEKQNPVFKILSEFINFHGDVIPYSHLINRMCFWMATGSGKTLVMVKLIEHLHSLKKHGEIPPHNILILAPSEHLIGQIRHTIDEFNQSGKLQINLVPLRQTGRGPYQQKLGDSATVYYHRSDNISDVQKDALTDYRTYENGGKWYVLLDEAHKGGKDESKRQAYYAIMVREGFLFNFSATFTDRVDILTTVKKYNLEEFTKNGYGKSIYLNEREYSAFRNREEEISHAERQKIVLKSLITLAYVSVRVDMLREKTGLRELYHLPLMLTLVNSVNTDIENERNDLWAFFQTLREIATGEIDGKIFEDSKKELIKDWENASLLFGEDGGGIIGIDETPIKTMKITDLRKAVFLSRRKGALQYIRSSDNKELAFQMKNADSPFALIRIGDTAKWRNQILVGYEETTALQEQSFFDGLEQSPITILMGSRTFFESWDSNRPNVINFINIGGSDAKKFVVQSVGRGVRIETLPGKRRRLSRLALSDPEKMIMDQCHHLVQPPETLFLFATNRNAIKSVLEGLETEKRPDFEKLEGFEKSPRPKVNGTDMPLLVPEYRDEHSDTAQAPFSMSDETLRRFKAWIGRTSDSVLAVRDGLTMPTITALRGMVQQPGSIQSTPEKTYAMIPFLQSRLVSHISQTAKVADSIRELNNEDKDIVHFREIRVHSEYVKDIQPKIDSVKQGRTSDSKISDLGAQLKRGEITREEFGKYFLGEDEETFKDLTIKKLLGHYYLPVVLGNEKADYIQHIIKVPSEIAFINALEEWTKNNEVLLETSWDAWMFSKLDESLDRVHIPYYDSERNEYRRFLPDFVFWMCRENEYRIVFVDPKGEAHTSSYRKIDGYKKLFLEDGKDRKVRVFEHGKRSVSVDLLFYNPGASPLGPYKYHWIGDPSRIFTKPGSY